MCVSLCGLISNCWMAAVLLVPGNLSATSTFHTTVFSAPSTISSDGERVWHLCLGTTADLGTWRLPQDPASQLALDALRQKWPEISNGFCRWLEGSAENSLVVELLLQLPGGIERRFPRWKILRHVLEHSALHRGQVVGMIRMLGHRPPATSPMDYYFAGEADTSA